MAPNKRRASSMSEPPAKRVQNSLTMDSDSVISLLRLPEGVQVAREFANNNTTQTQVQAYAKLAGSSWTFYVQRLEVILGRRAADSLDPVDIDLGPSKVVSRRHATLRYDLEQRRWVLDINGRNGARVDCVSHKQGSVPLSSGNIIDIGGVQMMFVLPDVPPDINQTLLQNLIMHKPKSDGLPIQIEPLSGSHPNRSPNRSPIQQQPSTLYPNGVAIVTRPQVREASPGTMEQDLSSDLCKDIKPPYSYATMISQAILSTPDSAMSLADIYRWISSHYSFYRHSKPGWQNSIRHNLSLNKAFEKVPRKENEPGKGSKWQITPKYREEFLKKASAGKLVKGRSQIQFQINDKPKTADKAPEPAATSQIPQLPHQVTPQVPPQVPAHEDQEPIKQPAPTIMRLETHHQQMMAPAPQFDTRTPQKDEEPLLPQPLNHSPIRSTPWLSRFTVPRLGEETERPYLEFMEGEFNNSPQNLNISQLEAYTPDRGTNSRRTPLKNGSPVFWKYVHMNATPIKGDEDLSPVRGKKDIASVGVSSNR